MGIAQGLIFMSGILSLALVVYSVILGRIKGPQSTDGKVPELEEMKKYIFWRIAYINPKDPRGWVPKFYAPGITINFRTKNRAYVFFAMVVLTLLTSLLGLYLL